MSQKVKKGGDPMESKNVFIAYQDPSWLEPLSNVLESRGYSLESSQVLSEVLRWVRCKSESVLLLDDEMEGIKASDLGEIIVSRTGAATDKQGRIIINEFCQLGAFPEMYVVGDLAHSKDRFGHPLPAIAPVAMKQGRYVAQAIVRTISNKKLKPFRYRDKGNLAVIGRRAAVAKLGSIHFSGYIAWVLWLFIHLMYLVEFENRLLVFIQWAFNYFTRNQSARLIAHSGRSIPTE